MKGVLALSMLLTLTINISVRVQFNDRNNHIISEEEKQAFSALKIVVNGGMNYIYPDNNNVFLIPNLTKAVHVVEVVSNDYLFPILEINSRIEGKTIMNFLNPFDNKIIKQVKQSKQVVLVPLNKINYFQPEVGFSILSYLSGSSGIMIGVGILMFFCYKSMGKLAEAQMAPNGQNPAQHAAVSGNRRN